MTKSYYEFKNITLVLQKLSTIDTDIKTGMKILKNIKNIKNELDIYIEKEKEIEDKYIPRDESGDIIYSNEEKTAYQPMNQEERFRELLEMSEILIDIDLDSLDLSSLDVKLPAVELAHIIDIVE